jgi:hypothetical protein
VSIKKATKYFKQVKKNGIKSGQTYFIPVIMTNKHEKYFQEKELATSSLKPPSPAFPIP